MVDVIKDSQAWLARQLKSHMSQTATYRRGSDLFNLAVTICPVSDGLGSPFGGGQIRRTSKDFIAAVADLELGPPISGDLIEIEEQGVTNRYQLVPPDDNVPVAEPVDAFGYQVRMHAKFLKAV